MDDGRKFISFMCRYNCNVNIKDIYYKIFLLYVCEIGDKKILEIFMFVSDLDIFKCKDFFNGFIFFYMLVMKNDFECVIFIFKYLLERSFINI